MFPFERLSELNVDITRLVTDSRAVQPGDTFIACPGETLDGRQFIAQAITQGANAVIWDSHNFTWNPDWQVTNLGVADLRHKAGDLADAVYGKPSERMHVVGVTGTNGKTSTSHWIAQALGDAGNKCALIGTLGNGFAGELQPSANTTPDAIRVHGLFAEYLNQGASAVAMEVSSHALAQGRVNGVRFDIALLTNLSRDHLDYHGDMDSYAASKRRLFDWASLQHVVLNLDDAFGASLTEELSDGSAEVIGYGLSDAAMQKAEKLGIRMVYGRVSEMSARGMCLDIHSSWGGAQLKSGLIGRFNAENLLGVLGVLLADGMQLDMAVQSLSRVRAVAGRMQRLGAANQPNVVVDYAHTPDALEKVLTTLHEVNAGGELICVFGCGGDRDRGKREMMGRVAERFADLSIVTSDNPRSEKPEYIIADITVGMTENKHQIVVERGAAIAQAIVQARAQDTVLIAGKGHEDYQEIAGVKHPFSDVAVAASALQAWRTAA
ncbi:MAG: UDP-N-acetylmuramoyl-L-alanyl-D-glutamate--2,6-diaminopimelate ligase [Gallionellales bacterium GWA2_60_142]|nr:MAG: UDP-N-acetylmuramoyl-L-alanyl-D-glutamate--2,6-diaminopimelate ligase [Gallionellales bacterium GWA2_60_142]HCI14296.1 UDP-N-acetylmuramoyl-L-alanyl-D-glutamate--2,6-diaminopimelate ligase [Gallionellaceae bacterium]